MIVFDSEFRNIFEVLFSREKQSKEKKTKQNKTKPLSLPVSLSFV